MFAAIEALQFALFTDAQAEAVSLVLNYVTAYQMLHRSARVRPGQRVANTLQTNGLLLDEETANHMVENVVGVYGLPLLGVERNRLQQSAILLVSGRRGRRLAT